MIKHRLSVKEASCAILLLLTLNFGACVVYEPVPAHYGSSYDRVWDSAMGAAEDAGVRITSADKTSGIIRGFTGPTDVAISLRTQPDGRIRVEFNSKGPGGEDAEVNDRITHFYNRRMGR